MKILTPIILLAVSIAMFVFGTNKNFADVNAVKAENIDYQAALDKSKEVLQKRDKLAEEYKQFSQDDIDALHKIMPDSVDNIQLILDIDNVAKQNGVVIKKFKIDDGKDANGKSQVSENDVYSSITLSYTASGTYENFLAFLKKIETSLRIVDVTSLSFESTPTGVYDYDISIRTYWLK